MKQDLACEQNHSYIKLTRPPMYTEVVKGQAVCLYRASKTYVHPSERVHALQHQCFCKDQYCKYHKEEAVKMHSLLKPKLRKGKGRNPLGSPEAGTSLVTVEREDEKYSLSEGRRPLGSPEAGTSLVTAEREDEKYSLSEGRHPLGSLGTSTSLWTVERKEEKHSLHL